MMSIEYANINIGTPEIIIDFNYVIICGQIVRRPSSIAPSQWLRFWEHQPMFPNVLPNPKFKNLMEIKMPTMWEYWRDKQGMRQAIDQFPDAKEFNPVIAAAIVQYDLAYAALDALMQQWEEQQNAILMYPSDDNAKL